MVADARAHSAKFKLFGASLAFAARPGCAAGVTEHAGTHQPDRFKLELSGIGSAPLLPCNTSRYTIAPEGGVRETGGTPSLDIRVRKALEPGPEDFHGLRRERFALQLEPVAGDRLEGLSVRGALGLALRILASLSTGIWKSGVSVG